MQYNNSYAGPVIGRIKTTVDVEVNFPGTYKVDFDVKYKLKNFECYADIKINMQYENEEFGLKADFEAYLKDIAIKSSEENFFSGTNFKGQFYGSNNEMINKLKKEVYYTDIMIHFDQLD